MKQINLNELSLIELSQAESIETTGGDQFMKDLGYALGYTWGVITNFLGSLDGAQTGSGTGMNR